MKRFHARMSVRGLMVVVAVAAGWFAWRRHEDRAIAEGYARDERYYADLATHRARAADKLTSIAVPPSVWDKLIVAVNHSKWLPRVTVVDARPVAVLRAEADSFAAKARNAGRLKRYYEGRWW